MRLEDSGLLGPGERMERCEWCLQVWSVVAGSGWLRGRKVEVTGNEETRKQYLAVRWVYPLVALT